MKTKIILSLVSLFGLLLVIAWMANLFEARVTPATIGIHNEGASNLIKPELRIVPSIEPVPGTITAREATDVSSRILAQIETILARPGETVKAGQLLVQLDQAALQARKAQAEDLVAAAKVRLTESMSQADRIQSLFDQRMVSRSELDKVIAQRDALKANLDQSEKALSEADTAMSYSAIRAPIDGRIIDRYAEPGDTVVPGKKIISIYNPLSLRVRSHVREGLALMLNIGDVVDIEVPSIGRTLPGKVEEIIPAANPGARSFQIHVSMTYAVDLLPGMFARIVFQVGEEEKLLVPADRVAFIGQLDLVWVSEQQGVTQRIVKTGNQFGDMIEITSGLGADELVSVVP